jgi:putative transposase
VDESGIDDNEVNQYAWGPVGPRIHGMKRANRHRRISMISALNQSKIIAPFVFEGNCSQGVFEVYVRQVLLPSLTFGQTVILDNASIHKSKNIVQLIESVGCKVLFLPTYSPDLNPIEHYWASIKSRIRKFLSQSNSDIYQAAEFAFGSVSI